MGSTLSGGFLPWCLVGKACSDPPCAGGIVYLRRFDPGARINDHPWTRTAIPLDQKAFQKKKDYKYQCFLSHLIALISFQFEFLSKLYFIMTAVTTKVVIPVSFPADKFFIAIANFDTIVPKLAPGIYKSITTIEGDGGVGTIKICTHGDGK